MPLHPPESALPAASLPPDLAQLTPQTDAARDLMSEVLVKEIDATMPATAYIVNYEMNDTGTHLVISEAVGEYGEDIDRVELAHIEDTLSELGDPYFDFEGDLLLNDVDDFGWERQEPYDAIRDAAARAEGQSARAAWQAAITEQQGVAIKAIWAMVDPAAQSLDFSWDTEGRCLRLAAVIHPSGRTEVELGSMPNAYALGAHLTEPQFTPMLRNELSGLWRLERDI